MAQLALDFAGMDEANLVRHAQRGEREAFRAIMQRCNQRLFRVARAIVGNDDEAEDVLQDAYLSAFAAIRDFRGDAALATWLTAITLNEARGRLRQRRPTVDLETMDIQKDRIIPFPGVSADSDPEADAARAQTRAMLETAIDALPLEFRLVFIMREIEGCSVEETATQLDLNPQTVKTRLFRGRRMMRGALEKKFAAGLSGVFPFLGKRCANICERVLRRMG